MKMSMTGQMRMEQRMKLAPRMIQSMEVLQLPLLALQEKIETELSSNPVLEQVEESEDQNQNEEQPTEASEQQELIVKDDSDNVDDFERLDNLGDGFTDYLDSNTPPRTRPRVAESDKKQDALNNTAAMGQSLHDHLEDQWRLVDAEPEVKKAGNKIIDYIDDKGYLTVHLEQLFNKDRADFNMDHLRRAIDLVQCLEPAGVGAKDTRQCLLIQMSQFPDDMSFEIELVEDYWDELLENKLPQIAKKMNCNMDRLNEGIMHMSKLDTSPGLLFGRNDNHPITADVIVESNEQGTDYIVKLVDTMIPNLRVNDFYSSMSRSRKIDTKTREFLQQNIRSAQWLMDAIVQRKNTLLRVAASVVNHQKEFFDKGKLYLKPLPMATVANEVGVHIATISRAVAGKYIQSPQGIVPLRSFFSGGTDSDDGQMSWDAIRAKLQEIIDQEDKSKPFNDDQLREKLAEAGIPSLARRTVAKYRKLMNVPTARFRKKY